MAVYVSNLDIGWDVTRRATEEGLIAVLGFDAETFTVTLHSLTTPNATQHTQTCACFPALTLYFRRATRRRRGTSMHPHPQLQP